MNIVKYTIGTVICVSLTACSGLLLEQKAGDCYPMNTLSTSQRALLDVGSGNPILLAGDEKIVCGCYRDGTLVGASESDHLAGAEEYDHLTGADESDHLAGAEEHDHLTGADENDHLAGAEEHDHLTGADESDHLAGADEKDYLVGAGEEDRLAGDFAEFSCRIVPECSGFQLIGYEPEQITIFTATGRKSVPTKCITW